MVTEWTGTLKGIRKTQPEPLTSRGTSEMSRYQFLQMSTESDTTAVPCTVSYPVFLTHTQRLSL